MALTPSAAPQKRADVTFLSGYGKAKSVSHHRYPQVIKQTPRHAIANIALFRFRIAICLAIRQSLPHGYPDIRPAGAAFSCSPQLLEQPRQDIVTFWRRQAQNQTSRWFPRLTTTGHRRPSPTVAKGLEKRLLPRPDPKQLSAGQGGSLTSFATQTSACFRMAPRLGCQFISLAARGRCSQQRWRRGAATDYANGIDYGSGDSRAAITCAAESGQNRGRHCGA